MSGAKRVLEPLEPGRLGVYVCGPTVYDMAHVGHARVYVAFDTVVRYLRRRYDVTYVRNYTDIDDKIIARAQEAGVPSGDLAQKHIDAFLEDMDTLGVARPDVEPRVTTHLDEICALIQELIDKGFAYAADGDVYFRVRRFEEYGKLSRRIVDDMEAGARVEIGDCKEDACDFALWKGAREGEPSWPSPWGPGRPGWHIECSAMGRRHLGVTLDIHAGGKDLIFPHHENEIAQSEAANGCVYARYWMHNGFVNVDGEKMSKSLGNFFTIRDVLARFDPETLRYYLLCVHYRSPIQFTEQGLEAATQRVRYFSETRRAMETRLAKEGDGPTDVTPRVADAKRKFTEAMDDDFNTARVLADLSDLFKLINETVELPDAAPQLRAIRDHLADTGEVLGLFQVAPDALLTRLEAQRGAHRALDSDRIDSLVREREEVRQAKNFARADEIRDELTSLGVVIKDSPTGTTWVVE